MLNPLVALLFYLAVGVIVIRFGRSSYARPGITLERWYSYLPRKDWSRRLLRGISVFWVFGGFLIIATGNNKLTSSQEFSRLFTAGDCADHCRSEYGTTALEDTSSKQ